jgi:hypothetical protein
MGKFRDIATSHPATKHFARDVLETASQHNDDVWQNNKMRDLGQGHFILSGVMLSLIMLRPLSLTIVMLTIIMPSAVIMSVFVLSIVMVSVFFMSVVKLNDVTLLASSSTTLNPVQNSFKDQSKQV